MALGMIPACGSRIQRASGIEDSVAAMSTDIQRKARDEADPDLVTNVCRRSGHRQHFEYRR